jgi:hypothetical protein
VITPYIDLDGFRARTIAPHVDVDNVEDEYPGWLLGRLRTNSARINAKLRKRYATPFVLKQGTYPEAVLDWLTCLVTFELYLKRGVDPADQSIAHIKGEYDRALAELQEAADGEQGLFDLPVDDTADATAIAKGGPMAYSEVSPYAWTSLQRVDGRDEDKTR